jgi:RHS repeat-associated protein
MSRYQDPAAVTNPVYWSWQFDSLGQVLSLDEPTSAPQQRSYSDWGELTAVTWTPAAPEPTHSVRRRYDALGRLIHSEEQNGGDTDAATVNTYRYDVPGQSAFFNPTYVLGRLASAWAPTGDVVLSYDAYGNVNGRGFKRVVNGSTVEYIERHGVHGDGSRAWLELKLPDNNHQSERVDYAYDSGGRLRWMRFLDGADTQELYNATQVDAWGRLRSGLFGKRTEYRANYADLGRRLPQDVKVWSLAGTRLLAFTGFDAVGRETSRYEDTPTFSGTQNVTYDTLGRLKSTLRSSPVSGSSNWEFDYDAIGNIRYQDDLSSTNDTIMSYQSADRDRLCGINYFGLPIFGCTVDYDSFGNVVQANTRTGFNKLGYFNSGSVRRIENETGLTAEFRYDAFGDVRELDVTNGSTVWRSDRYLGAFITERTQKGQTNTISYVLRQFPGPGLVISRRGLSGPWIFQFSEPRGTRFTTDQEGNFAQDLDYGAFGATSSRGAAPGDARFSTEQWNEGDALDGFGLVHLGARIYDPTIGRFLSRDPLLVPSRSSGSNPYAFAFNDPVNFSDPSGLNGEGPWGICFGVCFFPNTPGSPGWVPPPDWTGISSDTSSEVDKRYVAVAVGWLYFAHQWKAALDNAAASATGVEREYTPSEGTWGLGRVCKGVP